MICTVVLASVFISTLNIFQNVQSAHLLNISAISREMLECYNGENMETCMDGHLRNGYGGLHALEGLVDRSFM